MREKLIYALVEACRSVKCCSKEYCERHHEECIDKLINHIAEVGKKDMWIPVTARLPEPMVWVLGCTKTDCIRVLRYDNIMDDWDTVSTNVFIGKEYVTHWMPLPQPPKEGAE